MASLPCLPYGPDTTGGLKDSQSRLDLIAGAAILVMFVGTYTLTVSRLGLLMIVGGMIVMQFLFAKTFRTKR